MANRAGDNFSPSIEVHDCWVGSIRSQCAAECHGQRRRGGSANDREFEFFFKVPADQRMANPKAYDPYAFTFGPYHAKFDLKADMFKVKAVQALVVEGAFQVLVSKIEKHDSDVRAMYIEMEIEMERMKSDTLACILALDSVAIVAASMERRPHISTSVAMDAILLENQVPLFALRDAIESMKPGIQASVEEVLHWCLEAGGNPFPELNCQYTFPRLPTDPFWNKSLLAHIYDAVSQGLNCPTHCPTHYYDFPEDLGHLARPTAMVTASQLNKYGIRFRVSAHGSHGTIDFDKTTLILSLPLIQVGDDSLRVISNLLAYEVTTTSSVALASYVYFMDRLIDDEKDVQLLVEAGVIENLLRSNQELAGKWNQLCVSVFVWFTPWFTPAYRQVITEMKKVTKDKRAKIAILKDKWRKWMAALKDNYCERQPWLIISGVAATILLVLSFLQTFYTMKPYFT